jgi:hypothetical protein
MDITAKVTEILAEQSGQGRNGTWVKISFVVETQEQYPRKICIDAWGDKVDMVKSLKPGETVKVDFDIESREYNGRWYTNVKAWRIEKQTEEAGGGAAPADTPPLPDFEEPASSGSSEPSFEPTDDLPF